jgi:TRAP-type C4-dicarboxylate transport system permease large subunit
MATVAIPEMKRYGYADSLAAGSVASGGGLGMIMPPSVVLIVYGVLTEQSIGALFVSGILPAVLLTVLFILAVGAQCALRPALGPAGQRFGRAERLRSLGGLVDTLLVFLLVIGGMFFGWFTPTEAASIGVLGVLALALARRRLPWRAFVASLEETLRTSCMVLFLWPGHGLRQVPGRDAATPFTCRMVAGFDLPPSGHGRDHRHLLHRRLLHGRPGADMLTIPISTPWCSHGYDPIWFGSSSSWSRRWASSPQPVGINVYVVFVMSRRLAPGMTLESIFKGTVPFLRPSWSASSCSSSPADRALSAGRCTEPAAARATPGRRTPPRPRPSPGPEPAV